MVMEWFRSVHGAPTHRKWLTIARKSGQPVSVVVSVVWALLDHASRQDDRGSVGGFSIEDIASYLGIDDEDVQAVVSTLEGRQWICEGRIASWEEHQVRRERGAESTSTKRVRQHRERQKTADANHGTPVKRHVTPETTPDSDSDSDTDSDKKEEDRGARARDASPCLDASDRVDVEGDECAEALAAWQALASDTPLPSIQRLTDARKKHLRARLADCGGIDGWRSAMAKIRGSPFLLGENGRGWKCDFDWVTKAGNFAKLMEGSYDRAGNPTRAPSRSSGRRAAHARAMRAVLNQHSEWVPGAAEGAGDGEGAGEPVPPEHRAFLPDSDT